MFTRTLLLSILLAVTAAACGDASDTATPTDGETSTSAPTTLPPGDAGDSGDAAGTRPADGTDTYAIADLTIVVSHPDIDDITYRISCLGDTATIDDPPAGVDAEAACTALLDRGVFIRLVEGPPADQVCTEQYGGPDVARITGTLAGEEVDATIDRTNGCGIFDWDDLLGDILPPALGITE